MQAAALATGQKHGDYTFFLKVHGHSSLYKFLFAKSVVSGKWSPAFGAQSPKGDISPHA